MCTLFFKQNVRKAAGPDQLSPAVFRHCADQLAYVFTDIFNFSLHQCAVPQCFKASVIIPVPKTAKTIELNDFRPVALTSVAMKVFERLVLSHLQSSLSTLMDPHQFAYQANRSVEDAINLAVHSTLQHLESSKTYCMRSCCLLTLAQPSTQLIHSFSSPGC